MTNLDSILKSRDITLPTKVHLFKAMLFPVVMYGCESWTVKKPECQKIDAFELWCWRRLLRVPWTARRSNQSILKKISPGCSLEGLRLKLKLQYFGHLMWRVNSLEKMGLMLGGIGAGEEEDGRGWVGCMASLTQWTWVWVNFGSWWWTGRPGVLRFMGCQGAGHDWATELNWMELREPTCQVERRSRASVTVECLSSTIWHAGWHKLQPRVSGLAPRTHWQVHYRMLFYGDLASWASADSAVPAAFCKNQLFYLLVKHTVILIGTGSD